ncbi:methyltransferase domain-containing protein [Amycolatopsis sp. FU40]|uniref:class I SAM-dependent methyltransferase n=1 Tax=Amycolatopsis sp. FU40 TaxID=2914159 RepID=UPI001EFF97D9|nr:class I SAM-dependent methyltransferase [Amycolatopsis sp. FU40]UKD51523.1 methyltransferase domain-containing protein [Amycolatopsis sp. FU40]
MTRSAQETFFRAFHASHPAVTSRAFGDGRSAGGRSSYELLRDEIASPGRVLDLACGDGFLLELLAAAGHQAIGVDLSSVDLALARQRSAAVAEGRAQQLPFADHAFDACVSHMAFMLMTDIDEVAAELARVLRPGGQLSLVLGGGPAGGEAYALFGKLLREILAEVPAEQRIPRLGDPRTRDRAGLDEILSPAGFSPVQWRTEEIDFSGSLDQVWDFVSTVYNLFPLAESASSALKTAFLAEAPALAAPDGLIPLVFQVHLASTRIVHKGQ